MAGSNERFIEQWLGAMRRFIELWLEVIRYVIRCLNDSIVFCFNVIYLCLNASSFCVL